MCTTFEARIPRTDVCIYLFDIIRIKLNTVMKGPTIACCVASNGTKMYVSTAYTFPHILYRRVFTYKKSKNSNTYSIHRIHMHIRTG